MFSAEDHINGPIVSSGSRMGGSWVRVPNTTLPFCRPYLIERQRGSMTLADTLKEVLAHLEEGRQQQVRNAEVAKPQEYRRSMERWDRWILATGVALGVQMFNDKCRSRVIGSTPRR